MENYNVKDLNLAEGGRRRMDWAQREMPVLTMLQERYRKERPFEGVRMSCCMHVTTETANLMRTMQAGGADIVLTASNPFQRKMTLPLLWWHSTKSRFSLSKAKMMKLTTSIFMPLWTTNRTSRWTMARIW